jgi:hypothetical protein
MEIVFMQIHSILSTAFDSLYTSRMPRNAMDNITVFAATICSMRFLWVRLPISWIVRQELLFPT